MADFSTFVSLYDAMENNGAMEIDKGNPLFCH
jgi:hypothetical protein